MYELRYRFELGGISGASNSSTRVDFEFENNFSANSEDFFDVVQVGVFQRFHKGFYGE